MVLSKVPFREGASEAIVTSLPEKSDTNNNNSSNNNTCSMYKKKVTKQTETIGMQSNSQNTPNENIDKNIIGNKCGRNQKSRNNEGGNHDYDNLKMSVI